MAIPLPGMRTSTFKKDTLVAREVDEPSGELVVNIVSGETGFDLRNSETERQIALVQPPLAHA